MANRTLDRLSFNWQQSPELFRRYWDNLSTAIEEVIADVSALSTSFSLISTSTTVSLLPASPAVKRRIVTDADSTTFNSIVAGGGSNIVPVFFDGTDWRIG